MILRFRILHVLRSCAPRIDSFIETDGCGDIRCEINSTTGICEQLKVSLFWS